MTSATTAHVKRDSFYHALTAQWLCKTLHFPDFRFNDSFFACFAFCCNGLDHFLDRLHKLSIQNKSRKGLGSKKIRQEINELIQENKYSDSYYELRNFINHNSEILKDVIFLMEEELNNIYLNKASFPVMEKKIFDFFNLDKNKINICIFTYMLQIFSKFRNFFSGELDFDEYENMEKLAMIFDIPLQKCKSIILELKNIGILDKCDRLSLNDTIKEIWCEGDPEGLERVLCPKLPPTNLSLAKCNIPDDVKRHTLSVLQHKGKDARHILLYGAPGTGKTTFAGCLAKELGLNAWVVDCDVNESTGSRRVSLMACIKRAAQKGGGLVIVDEAESLLDTDLAERHHTASTKAWLNSFLEQNGAKVIWITNYVEHIDPAVRRRFSYSVYFPELGEKERQTMWRETAKRLRVSSRLPDADVIRFAKQYNVQVATMESALRQAKAIAEPETFIPCVERFLSAQCTLQNNGQVLCAKAKEGKEEYNENGACLEQPLESFVTKCRRLDAKMRSDSEELCPGMGTMLFYGPPGTGKSALARHLAKILERPCVFRRASDLLDPYVGRTEQKIAEAFAEAERDGAVLVIDEADSFLQSREGAHANWEVTQTNEFLTQLEQFRGFCICTTNFRTTMDSAAMRRFSFKIPFGYAKASQVEALYTTILAPLITEPLSAELRKLLRQEQTLTPGDFHAVRMQFWLDDPKTVRHEDMIAALQRECRMKLESQAKRIGFVH